MKRMNEDLTPNKCSNRIRYELGSGTGSGVNRRMQPHLGLPQAGHPGVSGAGNWRAGCLRGTLEAAEAHNLFGCAPGSLFLCWEALRKES